MDELVIIVISVIMVIMVIEVVEVDGVGFRARGRRFLRSGSPAGRGLRT